MVGKAVSILMLPFLFCKTNKSVFNSNFAEIKCLFYPMKSLGLVKKDMGKIIFVIPFLKIYFFIKQIGHDEQYSTGM